jgi:RHS repeat-associated protein
MSDGLGNTQYRYVPAGSLGAGQLASIDGPYANDAITQGYDALGRLNSRSVGGDNETFGYDALGRVTSHTNALGQFSFSYLGQTQQTTLQQLLGGFGISSLYASNSQDRQLSAIVPGTTGSTTAPAALQLYKARPENQLTKHAEFPGWSENYSYDSANRLTQASRPGTESDYWLQQGYPTDVQARIQQYANSGTTSGSKRATPAVPATPNGPGVPATPATPAIPAHKAQQVTLPGDYAYSFDAASNLTQVSTPDGSWSAVANANNQYSSAQGSPWVYDEAGNLLDDGKRSYRWDAQSRLVGTTDKATGQVTELAYDGLSRLTVVKTTPAGGATSETRYTWCGETICQKRNDSDTVQARYLEEGEVNAGQALYYVKDRLGSVTDVVDAQGNPQGQLDYGPYGDEQTATGTVSDKRYAGMQHLPQVGLYATHYRFYDANSARWLNRDPIAENGGINPYTYVGGNPLSFVDPLGLEAGIAIWQPVGWGESSFGHVSTNINGTTYSFGPGGMTTMPTSTYAEKNGFRDGTEVKLNLTPQQEAALQACLSRAQGKYNAATNNCGTPPQNCLKELGIDTGNQVLPVSLGNKLIDMGVVNGATSYPASRPANGWSAPWAR